MAATATAAVETDSSTTGVAEVRRTIRASQQRVFDAWTKAAQVKAWHAPGPNVVTSADIDLRVGGAHSVHMRDANGGDRHSFGVYTEVDPPRKIAYTWNWAQMPDMPESLVTVEFIHRGEATEILLRHSGLPTDADRVNHRNGWNAAIDNLSALLDSPTSTK
jgi:uncharacterized protein YndB with AHSA1/START domain